MQRRNNRRDPNLTFKDDAAIAGWGIAVIVLFIVFLMALTGGMTIESIGCSV